MAVTSASYNQPSVPARFQKARQGLLELKTVSNQPKSKDEVTFEARYGSRIRFTAQPLYANRPTYAMRDLFEARDVTETRNVYETRPVYAQRPVYETKATGMRDISTFASSAAAGLDEHADFSVQVGSHAAATVRFSASSIAVTVNGTTQDLGYTPGSGAFHAALTTALNSLTGLNASVNAQGKLELTTDNAESFTLAEVPNGFLDLSGTALDKLGLTAGTRNQQQIGTVPEQTGTEQVLTGTETVVVGSEQVKVGSEQYVTGSENYVAGSHYVEDGTENGLVGYDRVVKSAQLDNLEFRTKQISTRQTLAQLVTAAQRDMGASGPVGLRVVEGISAILTMLGSDQTLTSDKIDTAVKKLDQARGAYMTSTMSAAGSALSMTA